VIHLTSAVDGGEWSASLPGRALPPEKGPPGTHWIGDWVGSRAGMDVGARRKILYRCRGSNPDRPARSQTLYCLSYRGSWRRLGLIIKLHLTQQHVFTTYIVC
jgi:hypothetical protein